MPRTEADLDRLMTGVEIHKNESHRIGTLVQEEKITDEEIIDQSSLNDAQLYDLCDSIAMDRDEEFTKGDPELREGRRAH
jgi:hypothetical protein